MRQSFASQVDIHRRKRRAARAIRYRTDPRGNATVQVRNGAGELVLVRDALGTLTSYDYTADGNQ